MAKKKQFLIITAIIGIILVIISEGIGKKNVMSSYSSEHEYAAMYGSYLESEVEEILKKATGSNDVKVMITFKNSYVVSEQEENRVESTFLTTTEFDKTKPTEISNPRIAGVMIVCKGLTAKEDFEVVKDSVSTVLDISKNKIYIVGGQSIS